MKVNVHTDISVGFTLVARHKITVNGHSKVRHLKRLKLNCLKDDTAKPADEMLLQDSELVCSLCGRFSLLI